MNLADLPDFVEHFRQRVLADALQSATAAYWRRRADAFAAAMPREGDYPGRATPEQLAAKRRELAEVEAACRVKAAVMLGGEL